MTSPYSRRLTRPSNCINLPIDLEKTSISRNMNLPVKTRTASWARTLMFPLALLVLPVAALYSSNLDPRWVGAIIIVVNSLTYLTYLRDKKQAEEGSWRVSEARLHFLELLGGWPAAYVAQRKLRHKCAKRSYLIIFWLIVILYQLAAIDALLGWRFTETITESVELILKSRGG